jgi:hypothetical protein
MMSAHDDARRGVPRLWDINSHVAAIGISKGPYAAPKKAPKTTTVAIVPLMPTSALGSKSVTGVDGKRAMVLKTATPTTVGSSSTAATALVNVGFESV